MTATPHPVDLAVGAKVAELRKFRGQSQSDLAHALGITFQQVQKYERGANRISCSKLAMIAEALRVSPSYFFTDAAGPAADEATLPSATPPRLARAMGQLTSQQMTLLSAVAEIFVYAGRPAAGGSIEAS